MPLLKIEKYVNDIYVVVDGEDEIVFQGSITDCYTYKKLNEK